MARVRRLAVALLIGAALALGQVPFGLWPVAVAALVASFVIWNKAAGPKSAFGQGFWTGFGYGAVVMHWIAQPFLVDAATYGWMAPFGVAGMAIGFGLFWGAGFAIAGALGRTGASLVFGWTLAELARSVLFTGFPWALLSQIWINTPVYGLAAFVGPIGLSMVMLGVAALVVHAWQRRSVLWAGLAVLGGLVLASPVLWFVAPADDPDAPLLRLVQPNAAQALKWDPAWTNTFYQRQLDFSGLPGEPDLVIWPEVAVTFRLDDPAAPYAEIAGAAGGVPVILGGLRVQDQKAYNTMLVLDGAGVPQALYDKHHLVPFGEYAPGGELARQLGFRGLAERMNFGFSPGPEVRIVPATDTLTVLPMICYEAIFPRELRRAGPERPDMLLHLTNDAWFGTWAGPRQHLGQAQARAIEFGLPVVRVANTGISGVIDASGRVLDTLPLGEAGALDVRLPKVAAPTYYWRYGDSPAITVLIVLGLWLGWARMRYRIDRKAMS